MLNEIEYMIKQVKWAQRMINLLILYLVEDIILYCTPLLKISWYPLLFCQALKSWLIYYIIKAISYFFVHLERLATFGHGWHLMIWDKPLLNII